MTFAILQMRFCEKYPNLQIWKKRATFDKLPNKYNERLMTHNEIFKELKREFWDKEDQNVWFPRFKIGECRYCGIQQMIVYE